jgi:PqqD family protein of HPr-rel-A system
MLSSDDRPIPSPEKGLSGKDLGDEYLVYDKAGDRFHILNGSAREIYLLCDGDHTLERIIECMAERYRIDPATARQDTIEAIDRLIELGILCASPEGPAPRAVSSR